MGMRTRDRELGRGERVLPGLWRLRLPLPWPGVPHGNAWAIADTPSGARGGEGITLVDTGVHGKDSMAELERAMDQVGLALDQVTRLIITHAHNDHWGQAKPIVERAGCEMWIHPAHRLALAHLADPEAQLRLRLEIGRQSGVPQAALDEYAESETGREPLFAGPVRDTRELVDGVRFATDLGEWQAYETPGHSPSHVCLYQAEHRLLISGDHLLGRIVLWFDRGDTPDPVAEYLRSLDVVAGLRARLALSGHGKPFLDVPGHIEGSRRAVARLLEGALRALAEGPRTAMDVSAEIDGPDSSGAGGETNPAWLLSQTLCYVRHLEQAGHAQRETDGELQFWRATGS